jgi:hypothetical protein
VREFHGEAGECKGFRRGFGVARNRNDDDDNDVEK